MFTYLTTQLNQGLDKVNLDINMKLAVIFSLLAQNKLWP